MKAKFIWEYFELCHYSNSASWYCTLKCNLKKCISICLSVSLHFYICFPFIPVVWSAFAGPCRLLLHRCVVLTLHLGWAWPPWEGLIRRHHQRPDHSAGHQHPCAQDAPHPRLELATWLCGEASCWHSKKDIKDKKQHATLGLFHCYGSERTVLVQFFMEPLQLNPANQISYHVNLALYWCLCEVFYTVIIMWNSPHDWYTHVHYMNKHYLFFLLFIVYIYVTFSLLNGLWMSSCWSS